MNITPEVMRVSSSIIRNTAHDLALCNDITSAIRELHKVSDALWEAAKRHSPSANLPKVSQSSKAPSDTKGGERND